MQEIKLCRLEKWINVPGERAQAVTGEPGERAQCAEAQVIVGPPCDALLRLQATGHCVLAELAHLQGLTEEEIAEELCKEEAITQYENVCICAEELPQAYLRRIWCKAQRIPVLIAETERLVIRESVVEDAEAFWELYQDAECRKYLEQLELPSANAECREYPEQGLEAYRNYIKDYQNGQYAFFEYGMWTVVEKKSGAVVGRAGLEQQKMQVSLGYAILSGYRGRGYAVEACRAILNYCKECGYAEQVAVRIAAENGASMAVYRKLENCREFHGMLKYCVSL